MLASFLKRDLRNLFRKDASPNFQAQNGLLSLRSRWRSVRSLEFCDAVRVIVDGYRGVGWLLQDRLRVSGRNPGNPAIERFDGPVQTDGVTKHHVAKGVDSTQW